MKNLKIKNVLLISTITLVLTCFFATAGPALRISGMEFHLEVPAGEKGTATFRVMNDGTETIRILVSIADWNRNLKGENQFFEEETEKGSIARSCADWLTVSPPQLDIKPGQIREINVYVAVPPEIEGTYWAIVFVEGSPSPAVAKGTQVSVIPRFGVKIYETPPGTARKSGKVSQMKLIETNPLKMEMIFQNTGNVDLKAEGRLEIRDVTGSTIREILIEKFPILPGAKRLLEIEDKEKPPLSTGSYQTLGIIDYGDENLVAGQLIFEIGE